MNYFHNNEVAPCGTMWLHSFTALRRIELIGKESHQYSHYCYYYYDDYYNK